CRRRQIGRPLRRRRRCLALELTNLRARGRCVGPSRRGFQVFLVGRDRLRRLALVPVGLAEAEQRRRERGRDRERPPEGVDGGERLLLVEEHVGRAGDRLDAARLHPQRLVVKLLGLGRRAVLERVVGVGHEMLVALRPRFGAGRGLGSGRPGRGGRRRRRDGDGRPRRRRRGGRRRRWGAGRGGGGGGGRRRGNDRRRGRRRRDRRRRLEPTAPFEAEVGGQ